MYEERTYRSNMGDEDLVRFVIQAEESDLWIASSVDVRNFATSALNQYRAIIKAYGSTHDRFYNSFEPISCDADAPDIIQRMCDSGVAARVGPMAGVAGAISEYVGKALIEHMRSLGIDAPEVMVENGGDLYISSNSERMIRIYAGSSPLSNKLAIRLSPDQTPLGMCTSAGTVGHSVSFGKADAVCILSKDTVLADAVATATGNLVSTATDVSVGIEFAKSIQGIDGIVIIIGDHLGVWGNVELVGV